MPAGLRPTTFETAGGGTHQQDFKFRAGDVLLLDFGCYPNPLNAVGEVEFAVGAEVEAQHPSLGKSFHKGCKIESKQDDGTYTVLFPPLAPRRSSGGSGHGTRGGRGIRGRGRGGRNGGRGEQVASLDGGSVSGISVTKVRVSYCHYRKGTAVPPELIGHSKGIKQVLLERSLINDTELKALRGRCDSKLKKTKQQERAQAVEEGESVEVPMHLGRGCKSAMGAEFCCLDYLLSQQPDFLAQENQISEYIDSRGHLCIFLPKYHPGFIRLLFLSPCLCHQILLTPNPYTSYRTQLYRAILGTLEMVYS